MAVSCVDETKVVARAAPFQTICIAEVKPDPPAVKVNAGLPASAV